jgi:hypothetical protein
MLTNVRHKLQVQLCNPSPIIMNDNQSRDAGVTHIRRSGLKNSRQREEEAVVVAVVCFAAAWWQRRKRRHRRVEKKRWAYRPPFEYISSSFSLDLMGAGNCRLYLRFTPIQIRRLLPLLKLESVLYRHRYTADPETAFCVVAARLSSPSRWETLSHLFGRSKSWLSIIFNDVVVFLAAQFGPLLFWHPQLTYSWMVTFVEAVEEKCGVADIWGFVDGTFRGHCRPQGQEEQRRVYSGHSKLHGIKYQAIVTPDGLVSSLSGPYMGPVNDWTIWRRSGVEEALRTVCVPISACGEISWLNIV